MSTGASKAKAQQTKRNLLVDVDPQNILRDRTRRTQSQEETTTSSAMAPDPFKRMEELMKGLEERLTTKIEKISTDQLDSKVEKLEEKLEQKDNQVRQLLSQLQRQDLRLKSLEDQFLASKTRSFQCDLILQGLEEKMNETPQQCFLAVSEFFNTVLPIQDLQIGQVWRLGKPRKGWSRDVVVSFGSLADRDRVMSTKNKLRGKKNRFQREYFISPRQPEAVREKRRHQGWILHHNKQLPKPRDIKRKGERLLEGDRPWKPLIKEPSLAELVNTSTQELRELEEIAVHQSKVRKEGGSKFAAVAVAASTPDEVVAAQKRVRTQYFGATSVSGAFRIQSQEEARVVEADFFDDSEHGMGHTLQQVLTKSNATNVALFLVRTFSGQHIGARRFVIARELAQEAIDLMYSVESDEEESGEETTKDDPKGDGSAEPGDPQEWDGANRQRVRRHVFKQTLKSKTFKCNNENNMLSVILLE